MIEGINKKNGWDIGIHVDGASGGFVAPFAQENLEWDFRLKNVHSINASGHKYGEAQPLASQFLEFLPAQQCPSSQSLFLMSRNLTAILHPGWKNESL